MNFNYTSAIFLSTENSKDFEIKPFRVFLIIQNHWFFINTRESLLGEPLQVAFT